MKIAEWAYRHSRFILFLLAILVAAGLFASFGLSVALFPQVSFPRVRVGIDAGDRPAERMAVDVTYKVEEALRSIPGVRAVRSTTSRGAADVELDFDWGQDMVQHLLQVESQLNRMLAELPPGTTFQAKRMDPVVFPVIAYSLTSDSRSLTELRDLATYELRPVLASVEGVSAVTVEGGAIEEFRVVVDPARLRAFNMTLSDVASALSVSNVLTAVGHAEDKDKLYLVVSDRQVRDISQLPQTVLRAGSNGVVLLSDVAQVRRDVQPQYIRVTADGHDAVLVYVYQQPGGNTVAIASGIKKTLAQQVSRLPQLADKSVRLANWYDQSDLILSSEASVRDAILIGTGLAALVLLLFLRNWKITLIAMLTVPAVLAVTVLLLYCLGMSFNIMTLGGMAAAVGLIIDDAIVMVEQIMRRLASGSAHNARDRALSAADEFTKPLAGSSLSTIVIHIPPAFMIGVGGAFFAALSLSMAGSLIISFAVALLAIPTLAALLLRRSDAEAQQKSAGSGRLAAAYSALMLRLLKFPLLILPFIALLLAGGVYAFFHVPNGFMPHMDEGGFTLDYRALPGTSLTETDRQLRQLEAIVSSVPDVQTYSRRTGAQLGGALTETNTGDIFIRLKPFPRRPIDDVISDVTARVGKTLPGLEIETSQLMEDLIGDLTAVPQPIEIKLFSDDSKVLETLSVKVKAAIEKVNGVVEVKPGIVAAGDALTLQIDPQRAALEGVDPESITKDLADLMGGRVTTQIQQGPKMVDVRVWIPANFRTTDRQIGDLPLRAPDGHLFPLRRVATITPVTGQPEITREDLKRMVAVTGRIENRDLGSTVHEIQGLLDGGLVPKTVQYKLGGLYAQQQMAFSGLLRVIITASLLVFLLLVFLYESLRVAVVMLFTTLLAMAFVFFGLWATNTELNITAIMGMVMIVGNVTEVAIFYYSELSETSAAHDPAERLIEAGRERLRAILMTTTAAILALMTLALGIGQGSAMLQPLAIAIIFGLLAQLPLVLIVMPSLLMLLGVPHRHAPSAASNHSAAHSLATTRSIVASPVGVPANPQSDPLDLDPEP